MSDSKEIKVESVPIPLQHYPMVLSDAELDILLKNTMELSMLEHASSVSSTSTTLVSPSVSTSSSSTSPATSSSSTAPTSTASSSTSPTSSPSQVLVSLDTRTIKQIKPPSNSHRKVMETQDLVIQNSKMMPNYKSNYHCFRLVRVAALNLSPFVYFIPGKVTWGHLF